MTEPDAAAKPERSLPRIRSYLAAVGVNYLTTLLGILASMALTRQAFQLLGADALGQWFMLLQALALLPLLDLGSQALCTREVAQARGAGEASGGLQRALARRNQMLVLWPVLGLASLAALKWAATRTQDQDLLAAVAVILAANALIYPLRYPIAVLQGLQDHARLGMLNVLAVVTGTGVGLWLLARGYQFSALAAAWTLQNLLGSVLALLRLGALEGRAWFLARRAAGAPGLGSDFWTRGLFVAGGGVINWVVNGSDVLFAGAFLGPDAAASLGTSSRLVGLMGLLGATMGQIGFTRLAQAHGRDPARGAWDEALHLGLLTTVVGGLGIALTVLATPTFMVVWLGAEGTTLHAGSLCVGLIGLNVLMRQVRLPFSFSLPATQRDRLSLLLVALEAAAYLVLVPLALARAEALWALPAAQLLLAVLMLANYVRLVRPRSSAAEWGGLVTLLFLLSLSGAGVAAGAVLSSTCTGAGAAWLFVYGPLLTGGHLVLSWLVLRSSAPGRRLLQELLGTRAARSPDRVA